MLTPEQQQRRLQVHALDTSVMRLAATMAQRLEEQAKKGTADPKEVDALVKLLDRVKGKPKVASSAPADHHAEDDAPDLAAILKSMPALPPPSDADDLPF